jgi:hypothetical protein
MMRKSQHHDKADVRGAACKGGMRAKTGAMITNSA